MVLPIRDKLIYFESPSPLGNYLDVARAAGFELERNVTENTLATA